MSEDPLPVDSRDPSFLEMVKKTRDRAGRELLNEEDLIVLATEEISRTFTRQEKQYNS
jgi:hypothetical protein